jgi:hypothetical protein
LTWCLVADSNVAVRVGRHRLRVPYYLENKPRGLFKSETPAARVRGWVRGWVRFSEVSV